MDDYTRKFDFVIDQDAEIHRIMLTVYQALEEKEYIRRGQNGPFRQSAR